MPDTNTATEAQLDTIRTRAVNDEARAMMAGGVTLTHEQADELGGEALDWMRYRLALDIKETDVGTECAPHVKAPPKAHVRAGGHRTADALTADEADEWLSVNASDWEVDRTAGREILPNVREQAMVAHWQITRRLGGE